jgi:flavin-binding protein dodecin
VSVAKVIEITASSSESFEEAVRHGIETASESVHHIQGAWIKEQKVVVLDNKITDFRVDLAITFIINNHDVS